MKKTNSNIFEHKEAFVTRPTFIRRVLSFRYLLIVTVLTFAVLTYLAKQYDYFNFDLRITLFIQQYHQIWFDALMRFVSFMGNSISVGVLVILLSFYGYLIGKKHASLMLVFSTIGGLGLSSLVKILVGRPRPDPQLINQIGQFVNSDSFPSGHVLGAVSLYGFLFFIAFTQLKKNLFRNLVMKVCLTAIFLMGLSRIYLGAHWFSDVLGAYLLGFVWLSGVVLIYHKLKPQVKPK